MKLRRWRDMPAPLPGRTEFHGFRWLAPPANIRTALQACAVRAAASTFAAARSKQRQLIAAALPKKLQTESIPCYATVTSLHK
jgi:hypothetical protein